MPAIAEKLYKIETDNSRFSEAIGVLLLALSLAVLLSLISYDPLDPAWNVVTTRLRAMNWIGSVGAWIADLLFQVFGLSAFLIPLLLATIGWRTLRLRQWGLFRRKFLGLVLLLVSIAGLLGLPQTQPFYQENIRFGGAAGYLLAHFLEVGLNKVGTGILLSVLFIFSLMMTTSLSFNALLESTGVRFLFEGIANIKSSWQERWLLWRNAREERRLKVVASPISNDLLSVEDTDNVPPTDRVLVPPMVDRSRTMASIPLEQVPLSPPVQSQSVAPPMPPPPLPAQQQMRAMAAVSPSGRDMEELHRLVYGEETTENEPLPEFSLTSAVNVVEREMDNAIAASQRRVAASPMEILDQHMIATQKAIEPFSSLRTDTTATPPLRAADPVVNQMLASASIARREIEEEEVTTGNHADRVPSDGGQRVGYRGDGTNDTKGCMFDNR